MSICIDAPNNRRGDLRRIGNGRLDIHDEYGVAVVILQEDLKRGNVTGRVGIANDIDRIGTGPGWRQDGIETLFDGRTECRGNPSQFDKPIDCENTDTAAIGEHRQSLARREFRPAQGFRAIKQFAQVEYPQHAGAAECCVVHGIGAGERTCVGRCSLGSLRHASGFDDDNRLDARCGPRC